MGWSQSELARKLNCEFDFIREWEASIDKPAAANIENFANLHVDTLVLLEKQADNHSEQLIQSALAESFLEEAHEGQVHAADLRRHYFDKN